MSEQVVVGKRYTIVIPKSIRNRLRIREGQRLILRVEGERLTMEGIPTDPYKALRKIVGSPYVEKVDERHAEEWLRGHAGH